MKNSVFCNQICIDQTNNNKMEFLKPDEPEKDQKKPFKLCFGHKNLIGKSNIHIGRPLSISYSNSFINE